MELETIATHAGTPYLGGRRRRRRGYISPFAWNESTLPAEERSMPTRHRSVKRISVLQLCFKFSRLRAGVTRMVR